MSSVSDVDGGLYREKGLDPEAINRHKQEAGVVTGFPGAEAITNDTQANGMVRRKYRDHWGTPKGV